MGVRNHVTTFTHYKVAFTFLLYLVSKDLQIILDMGEHFIARNGTKRWAKNKN